MKPDVGDWSILTHHGERGSVTTVSWSPDGNKITTTGYWTYLAGFIVFRCLAVKSSWCWRTP
jgi:hypothetical protein